MPERTLDGRFAIVTGAGHGIGSAVAIGLARRGASVVAVDVAADGADAVVSEITQAGGSAVALQADVSDDGAVSAMREDVRDAFGPVDILVNNAAAFCHKRFVDHTIEDWDRVFAVNSRGVFLCSRAVLPEMIERRQGCIVNVASISAFNTTFDHVAYAASKAAVVTMTRDVAAEVAEFGVRVNAVAPGPIDSYARHSGPYAGVILPLVGQASDIADAVEFLASDHARFVTGQTLAVAGGADLRVHR